MTNLNSYSIESLWLGPMPKPRTLLVAYPHPDDESFGNGGTLARYVAQGVAVHYACATRGECGTVAPAMLDGYADVAALRTAEQECAARALGLADSIGFIGRGMAADIVAVEGNPLDDVSALKRPRFVMVRGRIAPG